jgi:hypothetical protein
MIQEMTNIEYLDLVDWCYRAVVPTLLGGVQCPRSAQVAADLRAANKITAVGDCFLIDHLLTPLWPWNSMPPMQQTRSHWAAIDKWRLVSGALAGHFRVRYPKDPLFKATIQWSGAAAIPDGTALDIFLERCPSIEFGGVSW